jgi:hypothetical protein
VHLSSLNSFILCKHNTHKFNYLRTFSHLTNQRSQDILTFSFVQVFIYHFNRQFLKGSQFKPPFLVKKLGYFKLLFPKNFEIVFYLKSKLYSQKDQNSITQCIDFKRKNNKIVKLSYNLLVFQLPNKGEIIPFKTPKHSLSIHSLIILFKNVKF